MSVAPDPEIRQRSREHNLLETEIDLAGLRAEHVAFPRCLFVHMSDACNLDCVYCGRQVHTRVKNGLMSYPMFEEHLGPYLHLVDLVQLYGTGEPMLHPHFMRMVELSKARGAHVMTTSNATLITPERADKLVELGLDWIIISMDGCTQDTFGKLRGNADLAKIKANIQNLNAAKQRRGTIYPSIEIACVVSKTNVHQLTGMVRMTRELGGFRIKFYNAVFHKPEHYAEDVSASWRFRWNLERARRLAKKFQIELEYIYQNPFPETEKVLHPPGTGARKKCFYATASPVVSKTGEVYPCCLSHYAYGKLGQDGNLWEILNNERALRFREGFLTGDVEAGCAKCGLLTDWSAEEATRQLTEVETKVAASAELSEAERVSLATRLSAERLLLADAARRMPHRPQALTSRQSDTSLAESA